jgi:hypothetical protein
VKNASGKLVILGILSVAVAAAGTAWWFRYNATRRAAIFWGSAESQLIRDASRVDLCILGAAKVQMDAFAPFELESGEDVYVSRQFEISSAGGLSHLRNALLEDRSYVWPSQALDLEPDWKWMLAFRDETRGRRIFILFTSDCSQMAQLGHDLSKVLTSTPIAAGLREVFAELSNDPQAESAAQSTLEAESTR